MIESDTLSILQQATTVAVAASMLPALPIKYINITFEVPNDQKYLETVFIPNNGSDSCWGDENQYAGLYRLLLHWPIDRKGPYAPMKTLESICSYFDKTRFLGPVKISQSPNMTSAIANPPETIYAASIRYARFEA